MGVRTVRMEPEQEKLLERIQRRTGWTASDAIRRGLVLLDEQLKAKPKKTAWEIYSELVLDPNGGAEGLSTETSAAARRAILRKHKRTE